MINLLSKEISLTTTQTKLFSTQSWHQNLSQEFSCEEYKCTKNVKYLYFLWN